VLPVIGLTRMEHCNLRPTDILPHAGGARGIIISMLAVLRFPVLLDTECGFVSSHFTPKLLQNIKDCVETSAESHASRPKIPKEARGRRGERMRTWHRGSHRTPQHAQTQTRTNAHQRAVVAPKMCAAVRLARVNPRQRACDPRVLGAHTSARAECVRARRVCARACLCACVCNTVRVFAARANPIARPSRTCGAARCASTWQT
jgi:hypothetical protein